ncbi:citramalate synthase [Amaricoccus tamworthensis]|uniref:citramalate synthase n=1 Tax=Amaricoccus tamworthensis TaxID=57002 RepID=UPI003C7CC22B
MTRERLYIYDTTLRDGQQTQGVDFTAEDKTVLATALDALGIDYVEGGWPGANPTDSTFFEKAPRLERATFAAFGMTKRSGRSAANDDVLAGVVNAGTPAVCIVGKCHEFHVETALGIPLEENLTNIRDSVAHLVSLGREALFDAEHFFDGYRANPGYALECLKAAYEAGARWVVLCDTNGGTLPHEVAEVTAAVIAAGIPGDHVGIHTHNDTENAVANSLAAVDAGARQVQGTLNGLGERCGNANLVSLIPTLLLKEPYASKYEIGVSRERLGELTKLSRTLDGILNRVPNPAAPYVGASAFAHKAGLHASAILKDPRTYEHVPPGVVGNERIVPMSNQAGQSNLRKRLMEAGIEVAPGDERLAAILAQVKEREDHGYAYDEASASFELLALHLLDRLPQFFHVERYRVMVERRENALGQMVTVSEAVVAARFGDERAMNVSESHDPVSGADQGPVNALYRALAKDLGPYQSHIDDMKLVDFRVRITGSGTDAVTRVLIDSEEGSGRRWSTVGVSANIVDASFQALQDAVVWKLVHDGAPALGRPKSIPAE